MTDDVSPQNVGSPLVKCKESQCPISSGGECYEGISDFTTCPNFIADFNSLEEEDIEENEAELDNSSPTDNDSQNQVHLGVDLYQGNELDYASSLRITRAGLTKVIVLAGANDAGKTTLLAGIYELFQQGPVDDYLFAGSETLAPFDRRCHLSRIESNRETEETERTKSFSEQTMLHLRARHSSLKTPAQNLLFSDLRGELFNKALQSQTEAQRIKVLKRADHLAILVDGAKIANLNLRNQAASVAQMTLRSFLEAGMIGRQTFVQILITKDDLLQTEDQNQTRDLLAELEREILRKHKDKVARISFHRIAARPEEGVESYGIPDIFVNWMENSSNVWTNTKISPDKILVTSAREFDRFAVRQLPDKFFESQ